MKSRISKAGTDQKKDHWKGNNSTLRKGASNAKNDGGLISSEIWGLLVVFKLKGGRYSFAPAV